ncbi:short-chain dehydrogenase [Marmoricola endophyticus]|uniref:Short-chain dehydrogenase n=1 Tax=Marmoricola endophyticus TaxID=2040280 RepID=A0A917F8M7_9ACTN|nr:mycofactocin-coupled SDR family oxidoreductase [Marmoricola endophyticus]GGF53620.1 short-chain dehydrogenase [Marmoricola endophyticus]
MSENASEQRVALVTGAGRGIGAATVRLLVERGLRVVAVDVASGEEHGLPGVGYDLATRAELEELAALGDAVETVVADVRDPAAVERAAARAVERWGRLDVAVAAAAVMSGGTPAWETPLADLDTLWAVDVAGVWHVARSCVPRMLAGPDPSGCRFVAVASLAAEKGLFGLAAYNAAKHAVVGVVRGLAADLVGTGVTAVAVSPGSTDTAMLRATAASYALDDVQPLVARQLLRRPLRPEEVAATIAFCCSYDGAALNGSVVAATGGAE